MPFLKFISAVVLLAVAFLSLGCPSAPVARDPPALAAVRPPENALASVEESVIDRIGSLDKPEDFERALAVFEEPGVRDRMLPEERVVYAAVLLNKGRQEEAKRQYERVLELSPNNPDALRILALFAELEGRPAEQMSLLERWSRTSPTHPEPWAALGWARLARNEVPLAQSHFEKSLGLGRTAQALGGMAQVLHGQERPAEALVSAEEAIGLEPANDAWYALRSLILVDLERPREAERAISQAVALNPSNPWHLLDRARLRHRTLFQPEGAFEDLNRILELDPSNFFGLVYRAAIHEGAGRWREGWADYKAAYALKPEYDPIYPSLSLMSFVFGDYEAAANFAAKSFERHSGEWAFPVIQALSLRQLRRATEAEAVLSAGARPFANQPLVNELFRFLVNPRAIFALDTLLQRETSQVTKARVQFYLGFHHFLNNQNRSAHALFREVSEKTLRNIPEINMAKVMVERQ